jgi:hypothetical protein
MTGREVKPVGKVDARLAGRASHELYAEADVIDARVASLKERAKRIRRLADLRMRVELASTVEVANK